MATQAVTLHRRDIERLLQAAGDARAIEQLAVSDDHAALIVVVLANPEHQPSIADGATRLAPVEQAQGPASRPRRSALARRRREVCKTQEGLAAEVGVQRSTVARWESGDTTPSLWARPRIANALGMTLDLLDDLLEAGSEATNASSPETVPVPKPSAVA